MTAASSSSLLTLDGACPMSPILILDLLSNRLVPSPAPGDFNVKLRPGATLFGYAGRGQSQFCQTVKATCGYTSSTHTGTRRMGLFEVPPRSQSNGGDSS